MSCTKTYRGPALFSHGFRPFFLSAALFGLGVVPFWLLVWRGDIAVSGPFPAEDWHAHEMIFGFAAAVVAGFLFTAVPNWTGRMPIRGWPLIVLCAVWVAGRLAVGGVLPLGPGGVMAVDCAFLAAVTLMIGVEIVAGRNWRNLMVAIPVLLLLAANLAFHVGAMSGHGMDVGLRLGLAVLIFLITLIGGRIIPSFTRNWLSRQAAPQMPAPFGRFDGLCLIAGAVALANWVWQPHAITTALFLALAAALHAVRMSRWRGLSTWRSPLLLMLHIAYGFIPFGLAATAAAALDLAEPAMGLHLFGIGAVGGMTLAVMMRATRGHTGRSLEAGPFLTAAFVLIAAAALVRALLPGLWIAGIAGITLSAGLWTLGFAFFTVSIAPWLVMPSVERRQPNRAAPA